MSIYVTSDLHFGHDKDFLYLPRKFNSIAEHDAGIIANWNSVVQPEDTVYVLGDIMLNDNEQGIECLRQLRGYIKIVLGNHDTPTRIAQYETLPNIKVLGYADVIKYKKYTFYLSHYPTITSNYDLDKPLKARVVNLCGHSHTPFPFEDIDRGLIYHVVLDAHDCRPVSLDTVIEKMKLREEAENQLLKQMESFLGKDAKFYHA